tara:strand:- start:12215 stop:12604 length:390 start_codon:yes stop_codon:yes gene_type:complete
MYNVAPTVESISRLIDQGRVNAYADAARDHNPLHLDTPEARAGQFGRPVAHGMLILAIVSEMMSNAFGLLWAEEGHLKVRWRAPTFIPTTVVSNAILKEDVDGVARYEIFCEGEDGQKLLTGTARVKYM